MTSSQLCCPTERKQEPIYLSAVATALAEVKGDSKRGGTRGNVDGGSTSEVETAEDEGPAIRVPGPIRDRIIDERCPHENEDEDGAETGTLGEPTDGERRGDGGEHTLEDHCNNKGKCELLLSLWNAIIHPL